MKEISDISNIIEMMGSPTLSGDATRLIFPESSSHSMELFGSDSQPIIALDGTVTQPLVDKTVALITKIVSNKDPNDIVVSSMNILITVPGEKEVSTGNTEPIVVPSLREWSGGNGNFSILPDSRLLVDPTYESLLLRIAQTTAEDYKDITKKEIPVAVGKSPETGDIFLTMGEEPAIIAMGKEGYILDIGNYVTIAAPEVIGVFYGTRSILQILKAQKSIIPKGRARDYPLYEDRGFMLDGGRQYFPMWFLNDYIKLLSWYKMNTLHFSINNDGHTEYFGSPRTWETTYDAFRIESKIYPNLAAKDGHYTQDEYRNFQKLAANYGVTILTELNTPAHALSLTRHIPGMPVYPVHGTVAGPGSGNPPNESIQNQIDITRFNDSFPLVKALFEEFIGGSNPVITANKIHVGTDEFFAGSTNNALTVINGMTISDHFRQYIASVYDLVRSHGLAPYAWGSLGTKSGDIPVDSTNVTLNYWSPDYENPMTAIEGGYNIINILDRDGHYIVPKAGYYLDYIDHKHQYNNFEPRKMGAFTFPKGHPQVKGGMFAIWHDVINNGITVDDNHVRAFPAIQVYSQKNWSEPRNDITWPSFITRANAVGEAPQANISGQLFDVPNNEVMRLDFLAGKEKQNTFGYGNALVKNFHGIDIVNNKDISRTVRFKGGSSYIETSLAQLGFGKDLATDERRGWTLSMDIMPDEDNSLGATLLESDRTQIRLLQHIPASYPSLENGFPGFPVNFTGEENFPGRGKLGFNNVLYDVSTTNSSNYFNYTVPVGEWTTITMTGDNEGTSLYVNGMLIETLEKIGIPGMFGTTRRFMQTLNLPLNYIGGRQNAFKGMMRNLRVYNRVFTSAEAKVLATESKLHKIKLLAILDYFETLNEMDNNAEIWSTSDMPYNMAMLIYNDVDATQEAIDKAYDELDRAILFGRLGGSVFSHNLKTPKNGGTVG